MALPVFLQPAADWIEANVLTSPEMAGVGLAASILLALAGVFWIVRRVWRWAATAGSAVSASARSRKSQIGYNILLSPPTGRGGGSAFKFLASASQQHMSSFSFDAPFHVSKTARITGGRSAKAERAARRRLKRAGADMIVWGERVGRGSDGLFVFTLSRAGGLTPDEAILDHFLLPSSARKRGEAVQQVAAYLLAKRLQPSLGRPADFRVERLEPVAEQLSALLDVAKSLSPAVRNELEKDYSAAALHVGESGGDQIWLDRVIELRRGALDRLGSVPQAGVWADAKLDLGRAMIAKAAQKFDPGLVAEGSAHLREAIEILKADPSIRRAEDAMRTLDSARKLTANRDRFSINFNG